MMMGFGLLYVVAIGGAIAYALGWRPQINQTGPTQTGQTPLEILDARYARGEITREEYEQVRLDLAACGRKAAPLGKRFSSAGCGRTHRQPGCSISGLPSGFSQDATDHPLNWTPRTRSLASHSLGNILLSNIDNVIYLLYVFILV